MKRYLCTMTVVAMLATTILGGCGNGTNKTAEEVNPVIEATQEEETLEEVPTIDVEEKEVSEVSETETEKPLVVDESILEEPLPESLEELEAILRAIPNGQLLSDFVFKVVDELNYEKVSDVEWCDILGAYIEEIEVTNPQLLQEFYDAEVE